MREVFKNLVLLGLVGGIVFLISSDLNGWGWLVFLFVLTLMSNEESTQVKPKEDEDN
jgi:hypothetical protein